MLKAQQKDISQSYLSILTPDGVNMDKKRNKEIKSQIEENMCRKKMQNWSVASYITRW